MKDKVAIVTGSSRGIGRAIALELASRGAKVVVNCKENVEKANAVVEKIKKNNGNAFMVQADVSDEEQVKELIQKTVQQFGKVDILVNNAGVCNPSPLEEKTAYDWIETLNCNTVGVFLCSKEAVIQMKKQKRGIIVNIASNLGFLPYSQLAAYCASKAGVISITQTFAKEYGPGIRVNAVAPGRINTEISLKASPERVRSYNETTPLGRSGEPEEIAKVVAFLVSDDSSYITGETIIADGGHFLK